MRVTTLKRSFALLLSLLLIVSLMSTVAFADPQNLPADTWAGGKIQVNLIDGETNPTGATINIYKLADVRTEALPSGNAYQPKDPEYTWNAAIAGWMKDQNAYAAFVGDDNRVNESFDVNKLSADVLKNFYQALQAVIAEPNSTVSIQPVKTQTAGGASTTIDGIGMGLYLVSVTGGMAVYNPTVVQITPVANGANWQINDTAVANMKGSNVTIEKDIVKAATVFPDKKCATASIGDLVSYKIVVAVPDYPDNAPNKVYIIKDTMEKLELVPESIVVKDKDGNVITLPAGALTYPTTKNAFTIDLSKGATENLIVKDKGPLTITYDAKLTADAFIATANPNEAKVEYSDPYGVKTAKHKKSDAKVYTYGIELNKVQKGTENETTPTVIPGAEFTLKSGTTELYFVKTGSAYVLSASTAPGATKTLVSDASGKVIMKGLAEGTYTLTETKAAPGYALPAGSDVTVEIKDVQKPGTGGTMEAGKDGLPEGKDKDNNDTQFANGLVPVTMTNTKGFNLPTTGGIGTVLFSLIGVVLMGGGVLLVAVFIRKRFMDAK